MKVSKDQIVVGIVCVGAWLCLIVPAGMVKKPHAPEPVKVAHAQEEPKQLKPEDYWVPLDNWLKKQGSPLLGRDFFEVGQQYKVDPDLLIAITKAETNLGKVKQRGSTCNVGSVGSYDSTNTTHGCSGYRHGIEQIAQTLNNPMLGSYTQIGQLSRAHNPSGHVYASSPVNWERNVLTTLSALKGKPIDHTYNFRRQ